MSHIFDRYFRKHGHYPRVSIDSGACRITIEFAPGYVRIAQSHPYASEIYITRRAWLALLVKALPITRTMSKHRHPDFDVPAAKRAEYQQALLLLEEKRALKRSRAGDQDEADRRQAQRQRFLKARERALQSPEQT